MVIPVVLSLVDKSLECQALKNHLALPGRRKKRVFLVCFLLPALGLKGSLCQRNLFCGGIFCALFPLVYKETISQNLSLDRMLSLKSHVFLLPSKEVPSRTVHGVSGLFLNLSCDSHFLHNLH